MPILGEVKKGNEIGKTVYSTKYIWQSCVDCSKERWVQLTKERPISLRCCLCGNKQKAPRGKYSPLWKGGRIRRGGGYVEIMLQIDDFFYPMANKRGYILEHRLVMAKHLGRCLHSWEIVHHKNHIKDDNRIENLQLVSDDRHKQITILENRIKYLEQRVTLLEADNVLLAEQKSGRQIF